MKGCDSNDNERYLAFCDSRVLAVTVADDDDWKNILDLYFSNMYAIELVSIDVIDDRIVNLDSSEVVGDLFMNRWIWLLFLLVSSEEVLTVLAEVVALGKKVCIAWLILSPNVEKKKKYRNKILWHANESIDDDALLPKWAIRIDIEPYMSNFATITKIGKLEHTGFFCEKDHLWRGLEWSHWQLNPKCKNKN